MKKYVSCIILSFMTLVFGSDKHKIGPAVSGIITAIAVLDQKISDSNQQPFNPKSFLTQAQAKYLQRKQNQIPLDSKNQQPQSYPFKYVLQQPRKRLHKK